MVKKRAKQSDLSSIPLPIGLLSTVTDYIFFCCGTELATIGLVGNIAKAKLARMKIFQMYVEVIIN
jgi:hypothetical protein